MKNEILIRRKNKVVIDSYVTTAPASYASMDMVLTLNKNLETLGYILSPNLTKTLSQLSSEGVEKFYLDTVPVLKKLRGAHVKHKPMYPNFPNQVMEMSEAELYANAFVHYFTVAVSDFIGQDVSWLPSYEVDERVPLLDKVKLTVLDLGTQEDYDNIFTNLVGANTSISEQDKEDIAYFISKTHPSNFVLYLPERIPQREILSYVTGQFLKNNIETNVLTKYFNSATDVLRLAVAMSDGDVSLAEATKFRNFTRPERKFLLGLLNNVSNLDEDMKRWKERWKRLGRNIRVGDYGKSFPNALKAFGKIRNDEKIVTFNGNVEQALVNKDINTLILNLKNRPSEFARRLDKILRDYPMFAGAIVDNFQMVADKVSTPVLLQIKSHFENRGSVSKRVVFPKGNIGKVQLLDTKLSDVSKPASERIVYLAFQTLVKRFSERDGLGKVFIDESLKTCIVPFSQRSASKALRSIVRGSRFDLPEGKDTTRFFIYWKNQGGNRIDIDLSAAIYDANFQYKAVVSYYNLKNDEACHSGDITNAPKGASEFIDINLNKVVANGGRYVVMSINSYTHQKYKDMDVCFAGWMAREKVQSGEIYDPKTVVDRIDLTTDSTVAIPLVIDAVDRKVIWADLASGHSRGHVNNVAGNLTGTSLKLYAIANMVKPNLYDLFNMHVEGRGTLVTNREEADTVFALDGTVTPFDIDVISSQYL